MLSINHLPLFEKNFKKACETHSYSTRNATTNLMLLWINMESSP